MHQREVATTKKQCGFCHLPAGPCLKNLDYSKSSDRSLLMWTCLFPAWISEGVDTEVIDEFVYRLFGLGLAVLFDHKQCERDAAAGGQASLLFPDMHKLGRGRSYPWGEFHWPLPCPLGQPGLRMALGSALCKIISELQLGRIWLYQALVHSTPK